MSTPHGTPEAAQGALHAHLVLLSDYYHRPTRLGPAQEAFELRAFAQGWPRVVLGVAIAVPRTELAAA